MNRFFRGLLALCLGACSVPNFGVVPAGSCAEQQLTGKQCGGVCAPCEIGQACASGVDCASASCEANVCVEAAAAASCTDRLINGAETDTDCGGSSCPACPLQAHCTRASDCVSTLCDAGVCAPMPSCTDQLINGAETDTDCGGSACPACALDKRCTRATDCDSALCKAGMCAVPSADPSCSDKQKNATETDVDCGGSCDPCDVDKRCSIAQDCVTLVCASVCQPAGCKDGVRNGAETDKDCGGSCTACDVGLVCKAGTDCKSLSCKNGLCIANTCTDLIKNGLETGKDCGGGGCAACPTAEGCSKASDCQSLVCAANKTCSAATCTDAVKNATESDVDCGKGCKGCQPGQFCNTGADCASATCNQNYCVPSSPSGGILSTLGWTATASDAFNGTADPKSLAKECGKAIDSDTNTRWSSGGSQYAGMYFLLDMKSPQIFFGLGLSINTMSEPMDYPPLVDVYLSNDGAFSAPPAAKSVMGSPLFHVKFAGNGAVVARYVKIVITNPNTAVWWGIRELTVEN